MPLSGSMPNTLYLPELREMLATNDEAELREFCQALHPARTAEFMEGLAPAEIWAVLLHAEPGQRTEIFSYFDLEQQIEIIETIPRNEAAELVHILPADERADILGATDPVIVDELLDLLPAEERRDIMRLMAYDEGTAGAVMTTDFVRLSEDMTVSEAIEEVRRHREQSETIYYLYVVDRSDHLLGVVPLHKLVFAKPDTRVSEIMQREVVRVHVNDDQEDVAQQLAKYDLLAIPVVARENRLLGIVTHDDILDVLREEATEDAHMIAGVQPLDVGYLETSLPMLVWKRGVWLTLLFLAALITAWTLGQYEEMIAGVPWLVFFIPLVVSCGGNTGNQSATLVITALSTGDIHLRDWWRVVRREVYMGMALGGMLGFLGYLAALLMAPVTAAATVVFITLVLVVMCGTVLGSILPLIFRSLGLDPALMSNPAVACLIDIVGVLIYMTVALLLLDITAATP